MLLGSQSMQVTFNLVILRALLKRQQCFAICCVICRAAGLHAPYIIKPVVACGLHNSHQMALVLADSALQQLQPLDIPTPAVVQEFVNHGGVVFKVYALGDKVSVWHVGLAWGWQQQHTDTTLMHTTTQCFVCILC